MKPANDKNIEAAHDQGSGIGKQIAYFQGLG